MLTAMQLGGDFAILTLGEYWPAMLRDLVKFYGVQDRCVGIERIEGTPFELMADPRTRRNPLPPAPEMRGPDRDYRRRGVTGLASAIGPLPEILLVDCLQASLAQMLALTAYLRMIK